ncbi:hypothetical protein [Chenggangzhangella methanolivorans]|uniref:Uncharacterized protein n=1 Tax=Chenggangzhangella methanolivorans TaxID=1437009 RepID=A0A9E6RFJ5_9HYPH|nr:hypothetical protein [Chenggangzhangella methanolivorans]QZO00037.1 hypothetical protein K6K41_26250 [Chenggangzhangella methanolivorans]
MTAALPKPDQSFSRAIADWKGEPAEDAAFSSGDPLEPPYERDRARWSFAPYALAAALAIGAGAAAASFATAPALTDSLDTVAALDARAVGLDSNIDPSGQQKKAAALNKDMTALRNEVSRLQRALDQSKQSQSQLSKSAANAAANSQDEVRALKSELAGLQKTLDATRDQSSSKIETLSAKLDQSKGDAQRVAEMQERLDRMEKQATEVRQAAEARQNEQQRLARADDQIATGSVSRDARAATAAEEKPRDNAKIVRNWTVREVTRGVALLEGRYGMIEVVRGARAPGIGRVRSIERRDGQWVVVTDRGLVIERAEL